MTIDTHEAPSTLPLPLIRVDAYPGVKDLDRQIGAVTEEAKEKTSAHAAAEQDLAQLRGPLGRALVRRKVEAAGDVEDGASRLETTVAELLKQRDDARRRLTELQGMRPDALKRAQEENAERIEALKRDSFRRIVAARTEIDTVRMNLAHLGKLRFPGSALVVCLTAYLDAARVQLDAAVQRLPPEQ